MFDLRVFEHLVDGIDWATGYAGGIEFGYPVVGGLLLGALADLDTQRIAILRARGRGRIVGMLDPFGSAERLAEALPDPTARRGDVDIAVGGLEHAGRDAG